MIGQKIIRDDLAKFFAEMPNRGSGWHLEGKRGAVPAAMPLAGRRSDSPSAPGQRELVVA
jgi:hypothetical protein